MVEEKGVNGLPPHLTEADVPEAKPVWRHQWLYSMIPVGIQYSHWMQSGAQLDFPLIPYLTGFCRNCGKGFSQRINFLENGDYLETIMNVPQDGCIGPTGV